MENIGKYEILERIGSGGFGTVYKGHDPFLKRTVAIKTCTSDEEEFRCRFYREAEIFGSLQHPNITTVHDFGIHNEIPFLVQEFLSGEDLSALIRRGDPLPLEVKVGYLVQISRALEHAHSLGVIHRDIKPGNIRLLDDGSVKVMDFGIAKLAHLQTQLTRTGAMVGTASYLSPEQISEEELDHRCDIFSFGVVAYELLVYQRPFAGSTISSLVYEILHKNPRPITEVWPECPAALVNLVMGCLERNRENRPRDFGEILARLLPLTAAGDSQSGMLFTERTLAFPPDHSDHLPTLSTDRLAHTGPTESVTTGEGQPFTSRSFLPASRPLVVTTVIGLVLIILGFVGFGAWRLGRQSSGGIEHLTGGVKTGDSSFVDSRAPMAEPLPLEAEPSAAPVDDPPAPIIDSPTPPVELSEQVRPDPEPLKREAREEFARPDSSAMSIPERTVRVAAERPTVAPTGSQESAEEEPLPLPAENQSPAVLEALERYKQAYENLDSEALELAWPSLESQQLRALEKSFSSYQWLEMGIENCNVEVDGAQATATCQVRRVIKPRAGSKQTDQRQTTFYLQLDNDRWVIDRL